jgi:PEP-CTERM motif
LGTNKIIRTCVSLSLAILVVGFGASNASASTLYSDLPVGYAPGANPTLPNTGFGSDNSSSIPFDLNQISEFGGLINLDGTGAMALTGGTVALDNYATAAQYNTTACELSGVCTSSGYFANVTVNAYTIGTQNGAPAGDPVFQPVPLASQTTQVFIAWAPTTNPGPTCADGQPSFNTSIQPNQCGVINLVNFNLSAAVPSSFIYTVSLTNNLTPSGTANDGPFDSLNLGMNAFAAGDPLNPSSVGVSNPDTAYYNAAVGGIGCSQYAPALGCGVLAGDSGWGNIGYGEISFAGATPEPATFGLIGFGLLGLGVAARKRNRKN